MIQQPEQYYYRNPVIIGRSFALGLGNHGSTVRATYTVPANKAFNLCAFMTNISVTGGGAGQGYIRVDINGVTMGYAAIDTAITGEHTEQSAYLDIHCRAGDVIDLVSQNTGAATLLMVGSYSGNEYDAA